jgi:rhodanese-related sulfurtransferase
MRANALTFGFEMTQISPTPVIEPQAFLQSLSQAKPWLLLDVRRAAAFDKSTDTLANAVRCLPEDVAAWAASQSGTKRPVLVFCVFGHEVGAQATQTLRAAGIEAFQLAGGIEGGQDGEDNPEDVRRWRSAALPKVSKA